jgi:hypothetical protein
MGLAEWNSPNDRPAEAEGSGRVTPRLNRQAACLVARDGTAALPFFPEASTFISCQS